MRLTRDEIVAKGPLGRRVDPFVYVLVWVVLAIVAVALLARCAR